VKEALATWPLLTGVMWVMGDVTVIMKSGQIKETVLSLEVSAYVGACEQAELTQNAE
jgi:hypothetical protein